MIIFINKGTFHRNLQHIQPIVQVAVGIDHLIIYKPQIHFSLLHRQMGHPEKFHPVERLQAGIFGFEHRHNIRYQF